jgi:myosin heavy subunit
VAPKLGGGEIFTVKHTAMDVAYCVRNFRLKNKDEIQLQLERCIENSQNVLLGSTIWSGSMQ